DSRTSHPSQSRDSSSCSIAVIRAARSGCEPVAWRSDDGWRSSSGRAIDGYGTPRMNDAPLLQADVAVVGAGGAGLYAALRASGAGASVVRVSATPPGATPTH